MELEKKPKCRGCGKAGDEQFYFYQPNKRGKGGYLWHLYCYYKIDKEMQKVGLANTLHSVLV